MTEHPRATRKNLLLSATIEAGDLRAPVRIRNLSENGALIDGAALPEAGTALVLRRLEVEIGAMSVWRKDGRCGIRFDGTISVDEWVSGVRQPSQSPHSGQARVDLIQAAIRSGASVPLENRPASNVPINPENLERRIAEELSYVGRLLDAIGEEFTNDPIILQRHGRALQDFDAACQMLAQLGAIVASDDRAAAVDAVPLQELRARLLRK
jgi:hypothetical protein